MSSSTASSSSMQHGPRTHPKCLHDLPADILTSHTQKNPNRRFYCCSIRKWDDCDFFQWLDWPMPLTFCENNCERRLKIQQDSYEIQLQSRIRTEAELQHQLRLKTAECEALKAKLEEAVKGNRGWKNQNWVVLVKIMIPLVFLMLAMIAFK